MWMNLYTLEERQCNHFLPAHFCTQCTCWSLLVGGFGGGVNLEPDFPGLFLYTNPVSMGGRLEDHMVLINFFYASWIDINGSHGGYLCGSWSRWWFQIFFVFTLTWGDDPIWRSYFSNGLKPPPSDVFFFTIQTPWLFPGKSWLCWFSSSCRNKLNEICMKSIMEIFLVGKSNVHAKTCFYFIYIYILYAVSTQECWEKKRVAKLSNFLLHFYTRSIRTVVNRRWLSFFISTFLAFCKFHLTFLRGLLFWRGILQEEQGLLLKSIGFRWPGIS